MLLAYNEEMKKKLEPYRVHMRDIHPQLRSNVFLLHHFLLFSHVLAYVLSSALLCAAFPSLQTCLMFPRPSFQLVKQVRSRAHHQRGEDLCVLLLLLFLLAC